MSSSLLERYLVALQNGDRDGCRQTVKESLASVSEPIQLYETLLWPAMERIERLFRSHRICTATEHMATRINRCIADQLQASLTRNPARNRKVVISCADGEPEELSAQICGDVFEADGWQVLFVGSGVPNDEIMTLLGKVRPELLLVVGSQPQGVPGTRALIDMIREVDAHPAMNIMVSGGVFNRATGLWKEIRADLFAATVMEALDIANVSGSRQPPLRNLEPTKRRQRRRNARVDQVNMTNTFTLPNPTEPTRETLTVAHPAPGEAEAEWMADTALEAVER